jgi:2-aminoethylphosphonate-pyruvate transaminase
MFYALDTAVQELLDEGLEDRINRHKRCAKIIRDRVKQLGLQMLVEEGLASNTVTSVFLPKSIRLEVFIQRLDEKGYTVYPGKRHLKEQNMFQISNMGQIYEDNCHDFLEAMTETLEELGFSRVVTGDAVAEAMK